MPEVELAAGLAGVAVDGAGRGKNDFFYARQAHGFEHVVGCNRSLLEVEPGALEAPARFRVGGEMEHDVVASDRLGQRREIEGVLVDERRRAAFEVTSDEVALADR